ncbi:MAG TPA: methyl-accepting chemotaxis protein [Rectinemataceae bacterium]|nr:methyl-accepting chemotaxis protein [Rectinemataceae bacterium]
MRPSRILAFSSAVFALLSLSAVLLGLGRLAALGAGGAALLASVLGFLPTTPKRKGEDVPESRQAEIPVPETIGNLPSAAKEAAAREGPSVAELPALSDARLRIRFARAIAAAVPGMTEEAAFGLIDRFENMRSNTSKAARSARDFKAALAQGQGAGRAPVAQQAQKTREVIKAQRESIAAMTEHNKKGAKDLRAMGAELESGVGLLKGIEEITERSRLIAFNMAVEAARIGEKGRGFRVIVGELRKLNDQTADFSRQVSDLLVRFRDYNESIVSRLAEETERVAKDVQVGMSAADEAVESLIAASGTADDFARDVASLVEVIDGDLDGVLESLQFQDITRQMIEGALAILDEAKRDIEDALAALGLAGKTDGSLARREEIRKVLIDRSKTKGEKEALMEVNT